MSALCFGCSKPMDPNALLYTDGDLCSTCLSNAGRALTVPCRCGCGRQASPNVASYIGLSSFCADAARIRQGWKPVERATPLNFGDAA